MINAINNQYNALNLPQKELVKATLYGCSSVFFGIVSLICEKASEEASVMHIYKGISLIVAVESARKAWRAFQAAQN